MKYLISFIIVLYSFPCMAQEILKDSTDLMGISVLDSIQQLEEIVVKGYRPISKVTREGVSYSVKDTDMIIFLFPTSIMFFMYFYNITHIFCQNRRLVIITNIVINIIFVAEQTSII